MSKGSDLLAAALEEEGVKYIFADPGEENLDCSNRWSLNSQADLDSAIRRFEAKHSLDREPDIVLIGPTWLQMYVKRRAALPNGNAADDTDSTAHQDQAAWSPPGCGAHPRQNQPCHYPCATITWRTAV